MFYSPKDLALPFCLFSTPLTDFILKKFDSSDISYKIRWYTSLTPLKREISGSWSQKIIGYKNIWHESYSSHQISVMQNLLILGFLLHIWLISSILCGISSKYFCCSLNYLKIVYIFILTLFPKGFKVVSKNSGLKINKIASNIECKINKQRNQNKESKR